MGSHLIILDSESKLRPRTRFGLDCESNFMGPHPFFFRTPSPTFHAYVASLRPTGNGWSLRPPSVTG